MARYELHVVSSSDNEKLGCGVATTYRPVGDAAKGEGTCASDCSLLLEGKCYTLKGKTNLWQRRSSEKHDDVSKLGDKRAPFVRLHTSGDFFKKDPNSPVGYSLDWEYFRDVRDWAIANPTVQVWTYCHDIRMLLHGWAQHEILCDLPRNFEIVASCDTHEDRSYAKKHFFRTARVIRTPDEIAEGEVFCPYDKAQYHGKKASEIKVRCTSCRLCFDNGKQDIAFLLK